MFENLYYSLSERRVEVFEDGVRVGFADSGFASVGKVVA